MQVRKQQLELDMEQQTGSKSRKEYIKAVYCHSAYLTYMQIISCEMLGWMKHKLESRLLGKIINNFRYANDTTLIDPGLIPGLGRSPGEGNGKPTPVFLPGKSHGQRSQVGYRPWGGKRVRHDLATKQQPQW